MAKRNYKMPNVQQFLNKKVLNDKSEPPWVFLEREMKANIENKPYNEKVGTWLQFLKELKCYFAREARRKLRSLYRNVGPLWYFELSSYQRQVLGGLKANIHQDLIEGVPVRTRRCLGDIGISAKLTTNVLMKAMEKSIEDPGLFIWSLYTSLYKQPPSVLRASYELDASLMMSCLVFIDKDECIDTLEKLTRTPKKKPPPPPPLKKKEGKPNVRYGEYLEKRYAECYSSAKALDQRNKPRTPDPIGYKFKLRSEASYEKICRDNSFLSKRIDRNQKTKLGERVCTYKFWEPPSTLRNTDPKMAGVVEAMKTFKKKAKPKHKSPYNNLQFTIGGIAFCKGSPYFIINAVSILPTGYIPINGGISIVRGKDCVTNIQGYWKFPKDEKHKCDDHCDCITKWERVVMDYVKDAKCKCGHLYDFHNEAAVAKEKYFYEPTRHGPFWVDYAKVYQMDPMEDFIRDTVEDALRSKSVSARSSRPTLEAAGMQPKELLAAFLADISDTPLMIPHLPQANLLNNIQEWVRDRVQANLTPKQERKLKFRSGRNWVDLNHINFKATAYRIPFTQKQLHHMNWSHRKLVQKLFSILLEDFSIRNRTRLLEQSRLWWATMNYDAYPSQAFLDIFFTYMPGRLKDSFVINPYSSELTPKFGAKTCPL